MSNVPADYVNPYETPPDHISGLDTIDPVEARYARLGHVIVTWEKLRIPYNVLLVLVAGLAAFWAWASWGTRPSLFQLIGGAMMANLCFCAGHVVDGYLSWLGLRWPVLTWLLFSFGTLLAMLLTVFTVAAPPF